MKKIVFLVAALVVSVTAMAQVQETYPSYVQVEGYAKMEVEPDEFYLSIVINEINSKGKIPVEIQQRQMIEALSQLGIDVEKQLNITHVYSAYYKKNNMFTWASYELKLNTSEEVTTVYAALDKLGISSISVDRLDNSEMERYKEQVRADAMANAKKTAEALSGVVGQRIGKCFYICDKHNFVDDDSEYVVFGIGLPSESDEPVSVPAFVFKKIQLEHSVQAKFVLE